MRRGRISIGATQVGSFDIDGDNLTTHFDQDAIVRLMRKVEIKLTDGCSLEDAISRVSSHGLVLCLDYPSEYAAGIVGKDFKLYGDHKA